MPLESIDDWCFWKRFGIDRDDFYAELGACWRNWRSIPPTEPNLHLPSRDLCDLGQVDIVTAREPLTDNFVKSWLKHYRVSYDNYISVAAGSMKADLDYDVFIDDSPLNASKFVEKGRNVFLYSQPWNCSVKTGVCRIHALSEAVEGIRLLSP